MSPGCLFSLLQDYNLLSFQTCAILPILELFGNSRRLRQFAIYVWVWNFSPPVATHHLRLGAGFAACGGESRSQTKNTCELPEAVRSQEKKT